ncbi:MAG: DUF5312 domain-containing protein [Treponema sp.]|nr:DUF5312 domain-containing protein [Treponema sp.]
MCNFEKLVGKLSLEERQSLLGKLKAQTSFSREPLYAEEEKISNAAENLETIFSRLPWFLRAWYQFLSFFRSEKPMKIFENNQVAALGISIQERYPGLYDYQSGMLLPAFYRQAENLKEAARFFYSTLDLSVNRDKASFFAFLGSLEMPDVHRYIQINADPAVIVGKNPNIQDLELRQQALKGLEDALALVTDDNRNAMYLNVRSLNCLKELSSFLYDRLIMVFSQSNNAGGKTCPASVVKELLLSLNNILLSLKVVPQMTLLQSLFIFTLQEKSDEPGFDVNKEIHSLLAKAEEALSVIREFNKRVPLTWIIRCSMRDMSYAPREVSGGEDWLAVYREHWKRRIESFSNEFLKDRRRREMLDSFGNLFKGKELKTLENAQSDSNPDGMPIKGALALSFLSTFYSAVFVPEMNKPLQVLLIDGEFKKKEARVEYTESYNNIIKLDDEIKNLDRQISPGGFFGKNYNQARMEMSSLQLKRRKMQLVLEEIQEDIQKILAQAKEASWSMINILNAITGRQEGDKQDYLKNYAKLTAKDNRLSFVLGRAIEYFQTVIKTLDDIREMESGY